MAHDRTIHQLDYAPLVARRWKVAWFTHAGIWSAALILFLFPHIFAIPRLEQAFKDYKPVLSAASRAVLSVSNWIGWDWGWLILWILPPTAATLAVVRARSHGTNPWAKVRVSARFALAALLLASLCSEVPLVLSGRDMVRQLSEKAELDRVSRKRTLPGLWDWRVDDARARSRDVLTAFGGVLAFCGAVAAVDLCAIWAVRRRNSRMGPLAPPSC